MALILDLVENHIPGLHARGVTAHVRVMKPRDRFTDRRDFDTGQVQPQNARPWALDDVRCALLESLILVAQHRILVDGSHEIADRLVICLGRFGQTLLMFLELARQTTNLGLSLGKIALEPPTVAGSTKYGSPDIVSRIHSR